MSISTQKITGAGDFEVRVYQEGNGSPLVYLHGHEQHPGAAPFLQRLAGSHDVRAPEMPGFGESTGFEHIHGILDVVLFYRRLIESWNLGAVTLVGHGLGGMIAAELAATAPDIVDKLVLVDAYGLWLEDHPLPDQYAMEREELLDAKWHDPETGPPSEPSIFEPAPGEPAAEAIFHSRNLGTSTKFLWPIPDRGLARRLPYVQAPTLVLHGESDGLIPKVYGERFVALLPDARLVVIQAAGHLPMVENEDAFVQAIETFFAG